MSSKRPPSTKSGDASKKRMRTRLSRKKDDLVELLSSDELHTHKHDSEIIDTILFNRLIFQEIVVKGNKKIVFHHLMDLQLADILSKILFFINKEQIKELFTLTDENGNNAFHYMANNYMQGSLLTIPLVLLSTINTKKIKDEYILKLLLQSNSNYVTPMILLIQNVHRAEENISDKQRYESVRRKYDMEPTEQVYANQLQWYHYDELYKILKFDNYKIVKILSKQKGITEDEYDEAFDEGGPANLSEILSESLSDLELSSILFKIDFLMSRMGSTFHRYERRKHVDPIRNIILERNTIPLDMYAYGQITAQRWKAKGYTWFNNYYAWADLKDPNDPIMNEIYAYTWIEKAGTWADFDDPVDKFFNSEEAENYGEWRWHNTLNRWLDIYDRNDSYISSSSDYEWMNYGDGRYKWCDNSDEEDLFYSIMGMEYTWNDIEGLWVAIPNLFNQYNEFYKKDPNYSWSDAKQKWVVLDSSQNQSIPAELGKWMTVESFINHGLPNEKIEMNLNGEDCSIGVDETNKVYPVKVNTIYDQPDVYDKHGTAINARLVIFCAEDLKRWFLSGDGFYFEGRYFRNETQVGNVKNPFTNKIIYGVAYLTQGEVDVEMEKIRKLEEEERKKREKNDPIKKTTTEIENLKDELNKLQDTINNEEDPLKKTRLQARKRFLQSRLSMKEQYLAHIKSTSNTATAVTGVSRLKF